MRLKPGISFEELDTEAYAHSDLQAARVLNAEHARLFETLANAYPETVWTAPSH